MASQPASRSGQGAGRATSSNSGSKPKPKPRSKSTAKASGSSPQHFVGQPLEGCDEAAQGSPPRGSPPRNAAAAPAPSSNRSTASQNGSGNGGVVGTIKGAASKVSGPAVAVGATAVGLAGGLVLKGHSRRKKVLGIKVPRLSGVDVQSVAKNVGKASKQFGKTTKSVSKDMERVADQAERIGKILG